MSCAGQQAGAQSALLLPVECHDRPVGRTVAQCLADSGDRGLP
ncbi:hypothetical protein ACIP3A_14740 [Streptomyces tricolor]|nr:hypothetical protein [Streptomyces sp. PBH53]